MNAEGLARETDRAASSSRELLVYEDGFTIVRYADGYAADFKRLNAAWLTRYFTVEPIDERVLGNPREEILACGGEIIFGLYQGDVVGTVALKAEAGGDFELTKMAVDERFQGRGFGRRLLEAACQLAKQRGAQRVILYSQRSLQAAIGMYRKYGFSELELADRRYARCDIKMERRL